jgi:hypothetical protein
MRVFIADDSRVIVNVWWTCWKKCLARSLWESK